MKTEVPFFHDIAVWGKDAIKEDTLGAIRIFSMEKIHGSDRKTELRG